ncbi:MAG: hypothetical protein AB8G11_12180 [Saprospiraceae bacterium]
MDKLSMFTTVKGKYQYQRIFGLTKEQFEKLYLTFEEVYKENAKESYEARKALYLSEDNGLTARLKLIPEDKLRKYLHVLLYYIRHYPTFEVLGK